MQKIKLLPHQKEALELTKNYKRVAYYYDMGLGKTFIGSEKMYSLNAEKNLIICQKSKIDDWLNHCTKYYPYPVFDLRKNQQLNEFIDSSQRGATGIINYDLVWRRSNLQNITHFTLLLDESSYIKNENSKRSKFILNLKPDHVILLSGTPTGGKYEELWSQCKLLGWNISKQLFWKQFIITQEINVGGFPIKKVVGYKNVDRLKEKLREHGAIFKKTDEVLNLPKQIEIITKVKNTKTYEVFRKNRIVTVNDNELIGDTSLTKLLYLRQLASLYNANKYEILKELLESTNERVIVFYNFNEEYQRIKNICQQLEKPIATINGKIKNLKPYEREGSITLVQYQAGAMGLNLQKSNRIIYFSLPLSSELFEQSKKRIHRVGQTKTCFYYYLITSGSIEENILQTLKERKDFTDQLFREKYDE